MKHCYINGTKISLTTPESTLQWIHNFKPERGGYISIFALNVLLRSFNKPWIQQAVNGSEISPVHGKWVELYLKTKGWGNIHNVDGNFLIDSLLKSDLSNYFYGTNHQSLELIKKKITELYPEAKVTGYKAPPLISVNEIENSVLLEKDFHEISATKPNIIWIGMGGIKQDVLMYHFHSHAPNSIMIGVGAVFDYFTGKLTLGPGWIKESGLRWVYRLFLQPKLIGKTLTTLYLLGYHLLKSLFTNLIKILRN